MYDIKRICLNGKKEVVEMLLDYESALRAIIFFRTNDYEAVDYMIVETEI